ncbi:MAG: HAD family phosphatase [Rhodobacteraceae bacterium]|jgi:2-haloacid dehalogenase|nr:HAD family phosphatase [Paracoccaceae bacterium]
MKAIVFDIGNVLVRWDPHQAFLADLGSREEVDEFLARIGFQALNLRGDAGERYADLVQEVAGEADRRLLATYVDRYALTIAEPIEGTWALMERLRARGHAIHAITNWSAETWPLGIATHPRLGTAFGVAVVSGQERMVKPDPRIFALLCTRADLAPEDCLFIDDSARNVEAARAAGMDAVQFTTPQALQTALQERGLL